MGFTTIPDKATGDVFTEAMWDQIKDNFNTGIPVLLGNTTLGSPAASISFTGISQNWAHLYMVCYLRGDTAATYTYLMLRFNGDTGANYDHQYLAASGAGIGGGEAFAATKIELDVVAAATATANLFTAVIAEIPFYSQVTNNKAITAQCGNKIGTAAGNMSANIHAGFWRNNAAITQVSLTPTAGNFDTGSRATLYGMP